MNNYMLKIQPLKCDDIPMLLSELKICSTVFFDRLQQLKFTHGCHILFKSVQIAGNDYFFDEEGNILKDTNGFKFKFDYHLETLNDKNTLHFILF